MELRKREHKNYSSNLYFPSFICQHKYLFRDTQKSNTHKYCCVLQFKNVLIPVSLNYLTFQYILPSFSIVIRSLCMPLLAFVVVCLHYILFVVYIFTSKFHKMKLSLLYFIQLVVYFMFKTAKRNREKKKCLFGIRVQGVYICICYASWCSTSD